MAVIWCLLLQGLSGQIYYKRCDTLTSSPVNKRNREQNISIRFKGNLSLLKMGIRYKQASVHILDY